MATTLLRSSALVRRGAAVAVASSGGARGFSALSLAEEYPDVPAYSTSKKGSTASTTTLPCGLTIVTEDASAVSAASITFPFAGSRSESATELGAALANRYLAFKSGSGLSSLLILRHVEDRGAEVFASAGRQGATVGVIANSATDAAFLAPLLAVDCDFEKWDVRDALKSANDAAAKGAADFRVTLEDHIYAAAYGSLSSPGRPYLSPGASPEAVRAFRERAYKVNGAVLAATGVRDHEAFVRAIEEAFPGDNSKEELIQNHNYHYVATESRLSDPTSNIARAALAFQGPDSAVMGNVLKRCIGLADGFALPGGLVGISASSSPHDAPATIDRLCAQAATRPTAHTVDKARAAAKAEALEALDSGSASLSAAMASTVLDAGAYSPEGVAEAYDTITVEDVAGAYDDAMKQGVSLAAVGNVGGVPYQATIASRFG